MICEVDPADYLAALRTKVISQKIPLSGSIDLTYRCNLDCVHCFVHSSKPADDSSSEMTTSEVLKIIDECVEAGCLYLVLTGGEPLLRKDFKDIYMYAKSKGLFLTLFTNATLVTKDIVSLFKEFPPRGIEVSLYGATSETYEKITGVKESFEMCMRGLKLLVDAGLRVNLKTVLMTLNEDEYLKMKNIANEFGSDFRFDSDVFPRLDGDKSPMKLRIDPANSVAKEFSDEKTKELWVKSLKVAGSGSVSEKHELFMCGAGVTGFHVSSNAMLYPCMMTPWVQYDLRKRDFKESWDNLVKDISSARTPEDLKCNQCDKKNLCGYCPGLLRLEGDEFFEESGYHCQMGFKRYKMLMEDKNL